jgi:hypothetical protein
LNVPKGSCVKVLDPGAVLLGGGRTFSRRSLIGGH